MYPWFAVNEGRKEGESFELLAQLQYMEPGIHGVGLKAIADISRSALCCHSNESRAPIANPSHSAQLEGTLYHFAKLHPSPCSSVGMRRWTDAQTHRRP